MARNEIVRRAVVSVLTFVLASVLAHGAIPSFLAWGATNEGALNEQEEESNEEQEEEYNSPAVGDADSGGRLFEDRVGTLWGISLLVGLAASALVWVPTAPKHSAWHRRRSHYRRSASRNGSARH